MGVHALKGAVQDAFTTAAGGKGVDGADTPAGYLESHAQHLQSLTALELSKDFEDQSVRQPSFVACVNEAIAPAKTLAV